MKKRGCTLLLKKDRSPESEQSSCNRRRVKIVGMAEKEKYFLNFLIHAPLFQVKTLLSKATLNQLRALTEVCFNLRFGELESSLVKSLRPYSRLIRHLSEKKLSITRRRKLASRRAKALQKLLRLVESVLP